MVIVTTELQEKAIQHGGAQKSIFSTEQVAFACPDNHTPPMVLIAAAGSGKTECLIARFEWCMRNCIIGTRLQILSFSNSASHTFQARFEARWGVQSFQVAKTLHSWVKNELLLPCIGIEHRVSLIIDQALELLRSWKINNTPNISMFKGLHIFIDEAQDCDDGQWELLALLRDFGVYVVVVGDPRQAIYGFQGAKADGLVKLHDQCYQARLNTNRRSTKNIVDFANAITIASLPMCPDTGLESEAHYLQTVPAGTSIGDLIHVHCITSLSHQGLKEVWKLIMSAPRSQPVCVLTWTNADALRLHHSLWLLGYETVVIASQDDKSVGENIQWDKLNADSNFSNLVHVRTIHNVKGAGYETVIFHIRGFSCEKDAIEEFHLRNKTDQQEELRRYYVACTRAKTKLHVIIQGPAPPLWWTAIAKNAKHLLLDNFKQCPAYTRPPNNQNKATRERSIAINELLCKYSASDSLLTHTTRAFHDSDRYESINFAQSVLSDSVEPLVNVPVSPSIPITLTYLQADYLVSLMRKYVFYFVFSPELTLERFKQSMNVITKIPINSSSLENIEDWDKVTDKTLYKSLTSCIGVYVENPTDQNFLALRQVLDTITRKMSFLNVRLPPFSITNGTFLREYMGLLNDESIYHVGEIGCLARKQLAQHMNKQRAEADCISCKSMFRKQTIFDSKYLSSCRNQLISCYLQVSQQQSMSSTLIAASGLLYEFTHSEPAGGVCSEVSRVLPYLGNSDFCVAHISLVDDCIGQANILDVAHLQANSLRAKILTWHSAEELQNCEIELTPEENITGTPGLLQGFVPIFVPSFTYPERHSTCIFFVNRIKINVEDEVGALVSAGLLSKGRRQRVVILEESTTLCYIFNVEHDDNSTWAATRVWADEKLPL